VGHNQSAARAGRRGLRTAHPASPRPRGDDGATSRAQRGPPSGTRAPHHAKLGPARHANDQPRQHRQHLQSSTASTQHNINTRYMSITSLSNMMPHHLKSSPA
jgi:hypothetical protein